MNGKSTHLRPLIVATLVLLAGIAASLAGNIQAINLGDSAPGVGMYISAIIWPLFLFGAIEVMLHTPWARTWRDALTRWAGLTAVAGLSLYISYGHLVHVLEDYKYDTVSAHLGPLAIDLMMAMATLAMNRVGQARRGEKVGPLVKVHQVQSFTEVPPAAQWTDEDQALLDQWDEDPIITRPVSPAPHLGRSNDIKPESVPGTAKELFETWMATPKGTRPIATDMYELVGAAHEVTGRTARRWYYAALPLMRVANK